VRQKLDACGASRFGIGMKTIVLTWASMAALALSSSCESSDQRTAREKVEAVKNKVESAAKQLGRDAKQLSSTVKEKGREAGITQQSVSEASPEATLKRSAAELKREAQFAGAEVSQAARDAKVKFNLSRALGLSAVSKIQVNSSGSMVTLRGSVPSLGAREDAERAALRTDGVRQVDNQLGIQP
jgi:osmotically-inducible protein OsmY